MEGFLIRDLILIPDVRLYSLMVLSMWCLGSSNIASHIYSRFFIDFKVNSLTIQMITKGVICLMGTSLFSMDALFDAPPFTQCVSILIGFFIGFIVVKIELKINRLYRTRHDHKKIRDNTYSVTSTLVKKTRTHLKSLHEHYVSHEKSDQNFSLMIIILIAIFEEILFRGYLVQCCLLLPGVWVDAALMMTVVVFGLSHASLGLHQILSKTLLGGSCLLSVLFFHTILPALIIHSFFNWRAYVCCA